MCVHHVTLQVDDGRHGRGRAAPAAAATAATVPGVQPDEHPNKHAALLPTTNVKLQSLIPAATSSDMTSH